MRSTRFTLTDCTAAIAVVVMLVVLLVPATLRARSISRQAKCAENFQKIGLALRNYDAVFTMLPPGRVWEPNPLRPSHDCSVLMQLLPYLELAAVYNMHNFHTGGWTSAQNLTTRVRRIEVFLCPDDARESVSAKIDPVGQPSNIAFSLAARRLQRTLSMRRQGWVAGNN